MSWKKAGREALKDAYMIVTVSLIWLVHGSKSPRLRAWLAAGAARAAYMLSRRKRLRVQQRLAQIFGGEMTAEQCRAVTWQTFQTHWQDIFNAPPFQPGDWALANPQFDGLHRIEEARAGGRGVILVESSGFGHRAAGKQLLHRQGIAVHTVHSENHLWGLSGRPFTRVRRHLIRPVLEKLEQEYVAEIVYLPFSASLGYARHLLQVLKDNGVVCVSGDGRFGKNLVELPFFDRLNVYTTGVASLSRLSGAPLLPVFCIAGPDGALCLSVEPALALARDKGGERSPADGIAEYMRRLEAHIRQQPGQYRQW